MKYVFITIPPFEDTLTCQAESSAYEKLIFYDVKVYKQIFNLINASIEQFSKTKECVSMCGKIASSKIDQPSFYSEPWLELGSKVQLSPKKQLG